MNITLSADKELIRKARQYASRCQTTLNDLIRDHMKRLGDEHHGADAANEFARLAQQFPGCSPENYRFDGEDSHHRELRVADNAQTP